MRELLTLTAACEIAALGRATQLEQDPSGPASTLILQPPLTCKHTPSLPCCLSDISSDQEVVTDNQKAGAA